MREELVRRVTVTSLRQEEMKTVIRTRFPKLEDLTEKIMRIISPKDHNHYPYQVKLVNTLRSSRQVNVRDLLKWLMRKPTSQQLAEVLFQDAVYILCRLSQKYPHPQASHLPQVIWSPGWKSVCPPVILSPILPPSPLRVLSNLPHLHPAGVGGHGCDQHGACPPPGWEDWCWEDHQ